MRIRKVVAGNGRVGDLWKGVKLAKNVNMDKIPLKLKLNGVAVAPSDSANAFAKFFL